MSSDKDVLLSMGFDPARVECMRHTHISLSPNPTLIHHIAGAVKATGGRGLQPAMDFILENEGKPVPDLSSVTAAGGSGGGDVPMDVDGDQEELSELQAVYGKAQVAPAAGSAEGGEPVEAKVGLDSAVSPEKRATC